MPINSVEHLIGLNSFLILVNLIPFVKFDGYWVCADALKLPKLRDASIRHLHFLLRTLVKLEKPSLRNSPGLTIYATGHAIFIAVVGFEAAQYLPNLLWQMVDFAKTIPTVKHDWVFYSTLAKYSIAFLLLSHFLVRMCRKLLRSAFNPQKRSINKWLN